MIKTGQFKLNVIARSKAAYTLGIHVKSCVPHNIKKMAPCFRPTYESYDMTLLVRHCLSRLLMNLRPYW